MLLKLGNVHVKIFIKYKGNEDFYIISSPACCGTSTRPLKCEAVTEANEKLNARSKNNKYTDDHEPLAYAGKSEQPSNH